MNNFTDPMRTHLGVFRYSLEVSGDLLSPETLKTGINNSGTMHGLLDGALKYYHEENIFAGTLPEICKSSKFSKNTCYKYFKSSTDIMTAALNREILALDLALERVVTDEYRESLITLFKTTYGHLIWLVEGGQMASNIPMKSTYRFR